MRETRNFQRLALSDYNFWRIPKGGYCSEINYHLQSFKEIVAACLVKDPKKRPTAEKLLKHRFFKHARSADYVVRTILDGLPPLGDRFRILKVSCPVVITLLIICFTYTMLVFHMPHGPGKRG